MSASGALKQGLPQLCFQATQPAADRGGVLAQAGCRVIKRLTPRNFQEQSEVIPIHGSYYLHFYR